MAEPTQTPITKKLLAQDILDQAARIADVAQRAQGLLTAAQNFEDPEGLHKPLLIRACREACLAAEDAQAQQTLNMLAQLSRMV